MSLMMKLGEERDICVLPVYAVSEDAAATILDLAATMGVDYLIIGASQRTALAHLLRGSVVTNVAAATARDDSTGDLRLIRLAGTRLQVLQRFGTAATFGMAAIRSAGSARMFRFCIALRMLNLRHMSRPKF